MNNLILNSKFENNSEEESEIFISTLDNIDFNQTEDSIVLILKTLSQKIQQYNPVFESNDYYMIIKCMSIIQSEIKDNVNIQDELINCIKLTIQSGWTATNCDLLDLMMNSLNENYFENLSENQLVHHLSVFDVMDLAISTHQKKNYKYIRGFQNDFSLYMFVSEIPASKFEKYPEIFQKYAHSLYLKSWNNIPQETEIFSTILHRSSSQLEKLFLQFPDNFVKIFCEISDKLITENISTKMGKEMIKQFYHSASAVLKKSKDNLEKMMDKWIKAFLDLYKLKQPWMKETLRDLSREIYDLDKKFHSVAFKNCEYLIKDGLDFLLNLIEEYPKKTMKKKSSSLKDQISNWADLVKSFTHVFLQLSMKTPQHFEAYIACMTKLIALHNTESAEIFNDAFKRIEKPMQEFFKNNPAQLNPLIDQCAINAIEATKDEDYSLSFPFNLSTFRLEDTYERITKFGKLSKAFNSSIVQENLRVNFLKVLSQFGLTRIMFIRGFQTYLIFKDYSPEKMLEFLQLINALINDKLFLMYNPHTIAIGELIKNISEFTSQSSIKYSSSVKELILICRSCLDNGLQWEDDEGVLSLNTNSMIILFIFQFFLITKPNLNFIPEFYSLLFETINITDESHDYYSCYVSYATMVPRQCTSPEILVKNIPNIIEMVDKIKNKNLEGNTHVFLDGLNVIISARPSAALDHLDKIENLFTTVENGSQPIIQILNTIYSEYPEKINENLIPNIVEKLVEEPDNAYFLANLIQIVSKTHSHVLKPLLNKLVESLERSKLILITPFMGTVTNILENDLSYGEQLFSLVEKLINQNISDNTFCICIFSGLRSMGLLRNDLLVKLKTNIENWQKSNKAFYDTCQHLLDIIADRSLAQLDSNINQQKKVVENIDQKLESQTDLVNTIGKNVMQQKEDIFEVNKKIGDTDLIVSGIKSNVKEIVEQVQEIDLKTVSSAPKWAREVSKLLNNKSNDGWTLLASRLGYSVEDIRAWSTHPDPCMSLLSDWFAVRRKVEATKAVLEQLIEMNRSDAAKIVENALIVAESMISDEDSVEFITPPPIFLSYQWGVQEEIKILKAHLQSSGFRCWMDIGQMGGGDKLYEAIDRGIRGSIVFVSCVTKKYSESPNCKRELNLAISLRKPVIPLQMERMDWPPAGTMGPLLTEYIFIRMFGKPGGNLVEGTFWPKDRFQELLMQIRYSCAPEYEIIDERYLNWWQPPDDVMKTTNYKPKENNISEITIAKKTEIEKKDNSLSPQIFISYQWSKQEEVKNLYKTLTRLGYSCWLDIYQMGGGDSLYEKIYKGIQGCKLMISCVTEKYADSPNCRREVSLCDNIKKPIIPIVLEKMTWPPPGPMSMILTQLVYISFVKDFDTIEEQKSWNGIVTNQLIKKIEEILIINGEIKDKIKVEQCDESKTIIENKVDDLAKPQDDPSGSSLVSK